MSNLTKISSNNNLDVTVQVTDKDVKTGNFTVLASVTRFTEAESAKDSRIVKKVSQYGVGTNLVEAQNAALSNCVELLGL